MSLPVTTQPWSQVVMPPDPTSNRAPVTVTLAKSLPAIARALGVYSGLIKQMPMEALRGAQVLPTPRILTRPDPTGNVANFLDCSVGDYLFHGNAISYVTSYSTENRPLSSQWLPASRTSLLVDVVSKSIRYWYDGIELDTDRVVHVQRGADPNVPQRGVGVVEQHLAQFEKLAAQDEYELRTLDGSAVPSVAVIAPNPDLTQPEADLAKEDWVAKYGGPVRKPAILPAGTQVIPLSWSPNDAQMTEARRLSLLDAANMFNLDGYWVGAPSSSMTYKSPAPMFLNLLRQSIGPVIVEFEQVWGQSWLPYGTDLRFQRNAVLKDDMGSMILYCRQAVEGGLWTPNEAREWMGFPLSPDPDSDQLREPKPTPVTPNPTDEPDQEGLR